MAALESIKSGSFKINAVLPEDVWDDQLIDIPEREMADKETITEPAEQEALVQEAPVVTLTEN